MSCALLLLFVIGAVAVSDPSHVESKSHLHLVLLRLLFLGPQSLQERQVVGCYRGKFCDFDV
eukprot:3703457-Prorocentrum_lima.AAC.1